MLEILIDLGLAAFASVSQLFVEILFIVDRKLFKLLMFVFYIHSFTTWYCTDFHTVAAVAYVAIFMIYGSSGGLGIGVNIRYKPNSLLTTLFFASSQLTSIEEYLGLSDWLILNQWPLPCSFLLFCIDWCDLIFIIYVYICGFHLFIRNHFNSWIRRNRIMIFLNILNPCLFCMAIIPDIKNGWRNVISSRLELSPQLLPVYECLFLHFVLRCEEFSSMYNSERTLLDINLTL